MRLSHLTALAVMVALVGAMFVAMGSASAAALGPCSANPDITLGFGDTCTIEVTKLDEDADDVPATIDNVTPEGATVITSAAVSSGVLTIQAGTQVGSADVTVTKPDTDADANTDRDEVQTYRVNVAGFGIAKVAVDGDNDNIVPSGPQVKVTATVRSAATTSTEVRLTVPTTGLSIETDPGTGATSQSFTADVSAAGTGTATFTVNTAGAPAGSYTLTFTADDNGFDTPNTDSQADNDSEPLTITVGDPGTGLASATLSLGNSKEDIPYTADNEAVAESGTASAASGDGINLVIEAFDSLGGKANASVIDQIIVIAPGGMVSVDGRGMETGVTSNQSGATIREYDEDNDPESADTMDNVGSRMGINVKKAGGSSAKPGMVTVYAIVSGSGGAATTDPVTLNFSGKTSSISIGEATDTLRSVNVDGDDANNTVEPAEYDMIKLAVTGADDGGIANDPGEGYNITITDPDGKRVNSNKIEAMLAEGEAGYAGGKRDLTLTGKGATGAALMAGEYTVMLKKGSLEASGTFSVAGAVAEIELTVDNDAPSMIGQEISFTATVTDANGNAVVDGTRITITASDVQGDNDSVLILALQGADNNVGTAETKDGVATGRLVAVGSGSAVVTASNGAGFAVKVITSTAGAVEEEAMPEEEASLSCLSSLSGFSTWTCDVEASASEIFDWISSRGATALHLNSNRMWVRYSVVDGAMVPGSSDFMVTKSDILYISN